MMELTETPSSSSSSSATRIGNGASTVSQHLGNSEHSDPTAVALPRVLTIRLLMSGKEVGSIIGKKGENVKCYREKSGAKINISDGSCPERVVTVTGTVEQIFSAFSMICQKFEDDCIESLSKSPSEDEITCPPVTLRVLVPAIQCGPIIGKGGCKIKEIRDFTGASIQVASELLPNSSERSVTISGAARAVTKCIRTISLILLSSPPKGTVIPYRLQPPAPIVPSPPSTAFLVPTATLSDPIASGQTHHPPPHHFFLPPELTPSNMASLRNSPQNGAGAGLSLFNPGPMGGPPITSPSTSAPGNPGATYFTTPYVALAGNCPDASYSLLQGLTNPEVSGVDPMYTQQSPPCMASGESLTSPAAIGPGPGPTNSPPGVNNGTQAASANGSLVYELVIPNDLIGCIIGRGGSKINEIRQVSKAQIKIANSDNSARERKVTIIGNVHQIATAKYLINNSMELHKHLLALNTAMNVAPPKPLFDNLPLPLMWKGTDPSVIAASRLMQQFLASNVTPVPLMPPASQQNWLRSPERNATVPPSRLRARPINQQATSSTFPMNCDLPTQKGGCASSSKKLF